MDKLMQFTLPGSLLLLTLAFGLWVSQAGRPYNGILFNVHKLLALGGVVLAVIRLSKILPDFASLASIPVLILVGLCVIALFASGALLSAGKLDYCRMQLVHRLALALLLIALAWASYLLVTAG